jgi:hypothetical protein
MEIVWLSDGGRPGSLTHRLLIFQGPSLAQHVLPTHYAYAPAHRIHIQKSLITFSPHHSYHPHNPNTNAYQQIRNPLCTWQTSSDVRHVEDTIAAICLHTCHHDPYEDWEKQTRRDTFVHPNPPSAHLHFIIFIANTYITTPSAQPAKPNQ